MSSAPKRADVLALWSDKIFSSAWLAATNKKQYLKQAEQLNRQTNILDVCVVVANVVTNRDMPLEVSVKSAAGLVEMYRFNIQSLNKLFKSCEISKIYFKRKEVEIEVHVKRKKPKHNFDSLDWENFDDVDSGILDDNEIMDSLLSSKRNTTVDNIEDITIREAPAPTTCCDADDDFGDDGPVASNETFEWLFFPEHNSNLTSGNVLERNLNVSTMDITRHNIEQLDDVGLLPVAVDANMIPSLDDISYRLDTSIRPTLPIEEKNHNIHNSTGTINRPTRISFKCYSQWNANYWKMQRKSPMEELTTLLSKLNVETMFRTPARWSMIGSLFERNAKITRSKRVMDYEFEQRERGIKRSQKGCPNRATAITNELMSLHRPIIFSVANASENMPINKIGTEPTKENVGYVSFDEMLNLLRSLWKCVPGALPFNMVKEHITNRFAAASVFANLLVFSAKGLIRIEKGENGSPVSLIKGSNWT